MTKLTFNSMIAVSAIVLAAPAFANGYGAAEAPAPVIAPAPVADDFWSGFYVGAALGYGSANYDLYGDLGFGFPPNDLSLTANLPDLGGEGFIGSLQAGYSHQFSGGFVLGVQLDGTWGNIENDTAVTLDVGGNTEFDFGYDLTVSQMYTLSVRGGFLVNPDTQFYGLVGYSRGTFDGALSLDFGGFSESGDYSFELNGLTFGGGIETRVTDAVSVGIEYRMTNFEDYDFIDINEPGLSANLGFETNVQTVRVFANYRF
jgi:outer membrane immunogenic protein